MVPSAQLLFVLLLPLLPTLTLSAHTENRIRHVQHRRHTRHVAEERARAQAVDFQKQRDLSARRVAQPGGLSLKRRQARTIECDEDEDEDPTTSTTAVVVKPTTSQVGNQLAAAQGSTTTSQSESQSTGAASQSDSQNCELGAWKCVGAELQRCYYNDWHVVANCEGDNVVCSASESLVGCVWTWNLPSDTSPADPTSAAGTATSTAVTLTGTVTVVDQPKSTSTTVMATAAPSASATGAVSESDDDCDGDNAYEWVWEDDDGDDASSSSPSPSSTTTQAALNAASTVYSTPMATATASAAYDDDDEVEECEDEDGDDYATSGTVTSSAAGSTSTSVIGGNLWAGASSSRKHHHHGSGSGSASTTAGSTTSITAGSTTSTDYDPTSALTVSVTATSTSSPSMNVSMTVTATSSITTISTTSSKASKSRSASASAAATSKSPSNSNDTTASTPPSGTFTAPHYVIYADNWLSTMPTVAQLGDYNRFILAFWMSNSGPVDNALAWTWFDADYRKQVLDEYHAAGIALMVSAFGSTDFPTSWGYDATDIAQRLASFVVDYGLDGVDIDYEDMNQMGGAAEGWLIELTTELRRLLPEPYLITHAPVAPWFTSASDYANGAYVAVNQKAGSAIDFYNVQFYNQGSDQYVDCTTLISDSGSEWPGTSVFEINTSAGVPLNKIVIGKPLKDDDASNGFMSAISLAACVVQAQAKGWNAGVMFWQWTEVAPSVISIAAALS